MGKENEGEIGAVEIEDIMDINSRWKR